MADDIKITGMGDQAAAPAPGGQGTPGSGQQTGGQATNPQTTGGDQLNPVIDLRHVDAGAPSQTFPAPGQQPAVSNPAPAAQQPAAPAAAPAPAGSPRRSNAILLGDEDETAQQPVPQEQYVVPALVQEKFPDLIQLIKETESMNDEERDYWFQILPIMTEDQIKKFRDILVNEKQQLASLDQEYEQELNKLNEKHMIEWKEFETKEKRKTLTTAEQASKAQEKSEEEDLLKRLSQV